MVSKRARRTFTIDPDVSEKVDELTDGHSLEINVLVNKALRRYVEWSRFVDSFKLVTNDPRLMKELWSHITIEDARKMGTQNGTDAVVEFILYYFHKFDLDSVLKTFRVIGGEYANAYLYSESGDKNNPTIVLRHQMGLSASVYYGASLRALCDRLGVDVKLDENEDQLICRISKAVSRETLPKTFEEHVVTNQPSSRSS